MTDGDAAGTGHGVYTAGEGGADSNDEREVGAGLRRVRQSRERENSDTRVLPPRAINSRSGGDARAGEFLRVWGANSHHTA